jgi:acyl carrier protein
VKPTQPIIDQINGFLSEEFEVEISLLQPDANLKKVLDLDSLDYIDLVVVIEKHFSFKVEPEDFIDIISFQDFYTYIISRDQPKDSSDAFMAGKVQG